MCRTRACPLPAARLERMWRAAPCLADVGAGRPGLRSSGEIEAGGELAAARELTFDGAADVPGIP